MIIVAIDHTEWHTHTHAHTVGLLWARDRSVVENYTGQHSTHKKQTSMPTEGFEPATPASERPQTYALNRAAIGIIFSLFFISYLLLSGSPTKYFVCIHYVPRVYHRVLFWRKSLSVLFWRKSLSVPFWRKSLSVPFWRKSLSVPFWRKSLSVPFWRKSLSVPFWRKSLSVLFWRKSLSVLFWRKSLILSEKESVKLMLRYGVICRQTRVKMWCSVCRRKTLTVRVHYVNIK
jgi:hypothetical protein